jgi:tetratricopeptide (TPR) repeat protein
MFVTFYSYKGGVGRTLALAHTAYTLAKDPKEPCRVLIWDFDLEAPGLQKIFKCKWQAKRHGFIDLVDQYKSNREVPPIEEYIHSTEVEGIDILPAGYQNEEYMTKFSNLSWRDIYRKDDGFSFVEGIKKQILSKGYDYVLIDSRTGYSDVSGICTLQLPDVVVLIFRLNDQNLDGIRQVHNIIRGHSTDNSDHSIETIPVISPHWPFSDKGEAEQLKKAANIFGKDNLLSLSFDPVLNYREKIFWTDRAANHNAQIATDYRKLASSIRSLNATDPFTILKSARQRLDKLDYAGAIPQLKALVKMRPDNPSYWTTLINSAVNPIVHLSDTTVQGILGDVKELIDQKLAENPEHAGAILAKALILSNENKPETEIIKCLDRALQASPRLEYARWLRATCFAKIAQYSKAIQDLDQLIQWDTENARAYSLRALCFKYLGQFKEAERDLLRAIQADGREPKYYHYRARLFLAQQMYEKAQADIRTELTMRPTDEDAKLTYSHILVGLGKEKEAGEILDGLYIQSNSPAGNVNLAEAWLVQGNPKRCLDALSKVHFPEKSYQHSIAAYIRIVANMMLTGESATSLEVKHLLDSARGVQALTWDWTELELLLNRIKERNLPANVIESVNELTSGFRHAIGSPSRSNLRRSEPRHNKTDP